MPSYTAKLIGREQIAEGTLAFHFEKPENLKFKAGQFINITLVDPPETDASGDSRPFTVASAPHEKILTIASRMRESAFKRNLKTLPEGTEVKIRGPFGEIFLPDEAARPHVFLAGGIGVTPFVSIARHAANGKLPHSLHLFYSNRRPEDAAFLEELTRLEKENPNFRFIGTMTRMEASQKEWRGETGYVNRKMLEKFLKDLGAPVYFVAGPPNMVVSMRKMLKEAGVPPAQIIDEEFDGYE